MEQSTTKRTRATSEKGRPQDADLAAMEKMYAETMRSFTEGSIVKGRILEIRPTDVLVDIGYKSEGAIPISEFRNIQDLHPGDEIEVLLEALEDDDGMVVLSYQKAQHQRSWDRVVENYAEGAVIEGTIKGRVKGGLIVDVGVDAFLPGSQVDVVPVKNPDELLNQKLEFKILKINKERRNIVLSRRELLEERRREQKRKLLAEIQPGQIRKGIVKNITDFGAFVDLNGMDGLLHVTDMSWGRINHPSELLSVGQEIEVVVMEVNPEKERVSLSLRELTPNPWEDADIKYPVGSRVRGRVVSLAPYGAFVQLEEGIEGLVHVSEMSWTKRVTKASDVLAVGDIVEAVVQAVDPKERKLSLSIRQIEENPWDRAAEKYPIGSRVKGVVRNFTNYGAFVELEPGIDGMIHVSDMSWTRKVSHPGEVLKKGDEVEAVVLEVDSTNRRIALGLKQAQEDPWAKISEHYKVGMRVKGKVTKLASFGAFVEIEPGVDGLVHISQISEERVQKVRDVLQPGQEVEARVIKVDPVERRIGLSIKAAKIPDDQFVVDESMLEGLRPGESLVDMASALEAAMSSSAAPLATQEWTPGQAKADTSSEPAGENTEPPAEPS